MSESMGVEVHRVAIDAGGVEKGVADGDLIIGFPLGKIERVRGTGGSRLVIMAVRCDGWHVPEVVLGAGRRVDGGGCDVRPAWDGRCESDGEAENNLRNNPSRQSGFTPLVFPQDLERCQVAAPQARKGQVHTA
jgi:hypothetical protein